MFVIAGVTGNTGQAAAQALLDQGQRVRVIVRSADKGAPWKARGADVFVGSLEDPLALSAALQGATGLYWLLPPDPTGPAQLARGRRLTEVLVEALTRAPVPHVVLLSSIGAQHAAGTGPIRSLHYAEERLKTLPGTRLTALRASYFQENLGSGFYPAREQGVLPALFSPTRKIEMVATHDIGLAVAVALREPPAAHRVINVAGPEPYSYAQAAEVLTKQLGKPVQVVHVPREAVVGALTQAGLSADMAGLYLEMAAAVDGDLLTFEAGPVVRGKITLTEQLTRMLGAR